jgi:hypothetical protein
MPSATVKLGDGSVFVLENRADRLMSLIIKQSDLPMFETGLSRAGLPSALAEDRSRSSKRIER